MEKINLKWKVGYTDSIYSDPTEMIDASVPGAVQLDYARSKNMPPFYKGVNFEDYKWMEDVYWVYHAEINVPELHGKTMILHFDGIDYKYRILANQKIICEDEGMFHPIDLDLSEFSGRHILLEVRIFPAPKANQSKSRAEAAESCKAAACYGWDWHPRLISAGIWGEAYIEIKDRTYLSSFDISYRLNDNLSSCTVKIKTETNLPADISVLISKDGQDICTANGKSNRELTAEIKDPELWYPIGYGEQNLYNITVTVFDGNNQICDKNNKKIGFRRSKLLMNSGSWDKPSEFPKSRSDAPATLEVNGIKLFAKGSNWVNAEIFPGEMNAEGYKRLLNLVRDANMNILRVWGGGFINKESFYDICDELGIMVWQEFPLSCNEYPDNDAYLEVLKNEAISIVRRLRTHPCLVLWCGGNELFNSWSKMTDQHHALRLLNSICYTEDRFTPFIPTSPLNGMAHGHYTNYDDETKEEVIEIITRSNNTAYTEFGCPGMAMPDVLHTFIDDSDYSDCSPDNEVWKAHHAFYAWHEDSWIHKSSVEYYYGGYSDTDDLSIKTNMMQSMCYKSVFEEMRRQWPHCSMALNWCLNEPWPTAANNSIISWPAIPKPAYYAVKAALRPQMSSLSVPHQLWRGGEIFRAFIWILNDSLEEIKSGIIYVTYIIGESKTTCGKFYFNPVPAQSNIECGAISFKIPKDYNGNITIKLDVKGEDRLSSSYEYPCRSENRTVPLVPNLNM